MRRTGWSGFVFALSVALLAGCGSLARKTSSKETGHTNVHYNSSLLERIRSAEASTEDLEAFTLDDRLGRSLTLAPPITEEGLATIPWDGAESRTIRLLLEQLTGSPNLRPADSADFFTFAQSQQKEGSIYAHYLAGVLSKRLGEPQEGDLALEEALEKTPVVLAGRILDAEGRPLSNATGLTAILQYRIPPNEWRLGNTLMTIPYPGVSTDANGCYYLPVQPGALMDFSFLANQSATEVLRPERPKEMLYLERGIVTVPASRWTPAKGFGERSSEGDPAPFRGASVRLPWKHEPNLSSFTLSALREGIPIPLPKALQNRALRAENGELILSLDERIFRSGLTYRLRAIALDAESREKEAASLFFITPDKGAEFVMTETNIREALPDSLRSSLQSLPKGGWSLEGQAPEETLNQLRGLLTYLYPGQCQIEVDRSRRETEPTFQIAFGVTVENPPPRPRRQRVGGFNGFRNPAPSFPEGRRRGAGP